MIGPVLRFLTNPGIAFMEQTDESEYEEEQCAWYNIAGRMQFEGGELFGVLRRLEGQKRAPHRVG